MRMLFERVVIFTLLLLSTGAGIGQFVGRQTSGGGLAIQLAFGALYACVFLLILPRRKQAISLLWHETWMFAFFAWAALSTAWSVEPGDTLRRSVALFGSVLAGLFIGMRYEPKHQISMIAACVALGAIASLFVCLFMPNIGLTPEDAWQGVYYPKNSLARMMSFGVLTFAWLAIKQRNWRVLSIGMLLLCLALMIMARSATGIVVCALLLCILPFRGMLSWPTRRLIALALIVALIALPIAAWSLKHSDVILDLLSRKSTLTGRLPLWHTIKLEILIRPALGFGFGAFWSSTEADRDRAIVNWDAPNAHNGFLEVTLGLGFIGLAIFLAGFARNFWLAISSVETIPGTDRTWPIFFLIFCLLYNLTETTLVVPNSFFSILYVANACWLVRRCRQPVLVPADDPSLANAASKVPLTLSPTNN
jgi:O-antigen ligase